MKTINALLAATLAVGASLLAGCSKSNDTMENVDYIPVQEKEDGRWSFISPDGKIELEDEFKSQPSMVIEGAFSIKEEDNDRYAVYSFGAKPEVIGDLKNLVGVGHYDDGLMPVVRKNSRIAIVDKEGKNKFELKPVKGKEILACAEAYSDGLLAVYDQDNKGGYVDNSGNVVIEPKYAFVNDFRYGLALVGSRNSDDEDIEYLVIDKSGETVFKIRKGQTPVWNFFSEEYIATKDENDRITLYNKKGETTKLSSKAVMVTNVKDKNVVFINDEDKRGVMTLDGEIIVRATYDFIQIMDDGNLLCTIVDQKAVIFNAKGEELTTINDYEQVVALGKFGLWAKDKSTVVKLDDDGKPVKNCEFNNISLDTSADGGYVQSDYFDTEAVVNDVLTMIGSRGVGKFTLGAGASSVLSSPEDYLYDKNIIISDLTKEGYHYTIDVRVLFNDYVSDYNFDASTYARTYYWKNSTIESIMLEIDTQTEWGNDGSVALVKAFQKKGATIINQTPADYNTYCAALKYNDIIVIISSTKGASQGTVEIGEYSTAMVDALKTMINSIHKDDLVYEEDVFESTDIVEVADSVVP